MWSCCDHVLQLVCWVLQGQQLQVAGVQECVMLGTPMG